MAVTQKNRPIQITTPLGDDVLLFYRMDGFERLNELFEYELELLSENADIKPDKLLGENITVSLLLADGSKRYFNGYITRFVQYDNLNRLAYYRATVRPWLWFLTRAANCRIFQQKKIPDIIKQVFTDQGFTDIKDKLSGTYQPREYCVQYRETDFNFVSRLMEEEGICYYFTHENGSHHLVLADSVSAHSTFPGYESLPYHQDPDANDRTRTEHIHEWIYAQEIQTGNYALTDYDFKKPKASLLAKAIKTRPHPHASYEFFDYPGQYTETAKGDAFVNFRLEEHQACYERCEGSSNTRGLAVGYFFKLADHSRAEQNRKYLVVSAHYNLQIDGYLTTSSSTEDKVFACKFTARDGTQNFPPARLTPKPLVHGAQTAKVVGPAGDEIYTDQYGRVKVQFHWDRFGKSDEQSSCWVRVSHPWAGKNWGMVAIPRIGHEVVIDFLEGDPDQPLIVGSVYNADMMPPYTLPANMTQTGIKSRSSKGGSTSNFNELRFEDKMGSEQVFLHAEKNQDIEVEKDETHWVGHNRSKTIDNDETTIVKHDRTETVLNNETITIGVNRVETVGSNETITVGLNRTRAVGVNEAIAVGVAQEIVVGAARTLTVGANQLTTIGNSHSVNVANDQSTQIGNNQSTTVGQNQTDSVGQDQSTTVGQNRSVSVSQNDTLDVGKNLVITAGESVVITTGKASITMKKDGTITISGKDITLSGSGEIDVKADKDVVIKGKNVLQN